MRMTKVAEYEVERLPVYSGTNVSGQVKTLSVWTDGRWWKVQIGNGQLYHCHRAAGHESASEFRFESARNTPQRWSKV